MSGNREIVVVSVLGLLALGLAPGAANADFVFGKAVNPGPPINSPAGDGPAALSSDGLELYLSSSRTGGYGDYDIWMTKRASAEDPWGPMVNLGPGINSSSLEFIGSLSSDDLTLYWQAGHPSNLYMAARANRDAPWGPRVRLGSVFDSPTYDGMPLISPDGLELFFGTMRVPQVSADIWVSTRASPSTPWSPVVSLGPAINSPNLDWPLWISPDGRILLFGSMRPGGFGNYDTYMITRPSPGGAWSLPRNLGPSLNTSYSDSVLVISPDGRWCYVGDFDGGLRPGGLGGPDLWQVPIFTIVDFNGDGRVDGKEVRKIADHWGTAESLCDIAPPPFGDGLVDTNDLILLAEYIGQEVNDPTLLAHWKLDETSGLTATDSVGAGGGALLGYPTWQPAAGKIDGALEFDGTPSLVSTKFARDPAQGPFSAVVWVKGGTPGRVIVSQTAGADWLYLDQYGMLATDLMSSGTDGRPLTSKAYVPDDQWHRVMVVWDGTNRALYVDGVEVARDVQANLAASGGSLQIGAGRDLAPASFWSGLIDDVRIYSRAVRP